MTCWDLLSDGIYEMNLLFTRRDQPMALICTELQTFLFWTY
jgi:hypothetical protein